MLYKWRNYTINYTIIIIIIIIIIIQHYTAGDHFPVLSAELDEWFLIIETATFSLFRRVGKCHLRQAIVAASRVNDLLRDEVWSRVKLPVSQA